MANPNDENGETLQGRIQDEVDYLWPHDKTTYRFNAKIRLRSVRISFLVGFDAKNEVQIAACKKLQLLYEGEQAMAGSFEVTGHSGDVFDVTFIRDIPDDRDVVNDELLEGKDFDEVLKEQLKKELTTAIASTGIAAILISLDNPTF